MTGSQMVRAGVVAAMGSWLALLGAAVPSASAEPPAPCSDVDVDFARATGEVPGTASSVSRSSTPSARRSARKRSARTR